MEELDSDKENEGCEDGPEPGPATEVHEDKASGKKKKHARDEVKRLTAELKERAEEVKDFKDKYLRAVADLQNYRKRVRREIQEAYESSSDRLLCDILPVVDNLDRALDHPESSDPASFRDGVRMIRDMLKAVLEDEGVKEFCSIGERFDPAKHEAVYAVESNDLPTEIVVKEIEKGYMMKDRLLRPARVTVSRGATGDTTECEQDSSESEETDGSA
jgi:molecular chaperone GrpE